jgi:hypothetical protein
MAFASAFSQLATRFSARRALSAAFKTAAAFVFGGMSVSLVLPLNVLQAATAY